MRCRPRLLVNKAEHSVSLHADARHSISFNAASKKNKHTHMCCRSRLLISKAEHSVALHADARHSSSVGGISNGVFDLWSNVGVKEVGLTHRKGGSGECDFFP